MTERDADGRFAKGCSGNPGGQPKETRTIKELARGHGPEAVEKLVEHMRSRNEDVSLRACIAILDRGFGKPAQVVSGPDDGPIRHEHGMSEAAERIAEEIAAELWAGAGAEPDTTRDREAVLEEQKARHH